VELHHENHDGSGYPYRLSGDQTPMGVRIVHVADAFDAMVTHRPYRTARSIESAIDELVRCSGTQFDPHVVDAFLKRIREHGPGEIVLPGGPIEIALPAAPLELEELPVPVELRRSEAGRHRDQD
jgi:HD-GYP domain-containing protein (c-di-GMP phosphodiesterase class II)